MPVMGYEGLYEVSSLGRVRSIDREIKTINSLRKYKGRILSLTTKPDGYVVCELWVKGKREHVRINRLVATAFVPNPENKPHVDHINGLKHDNRAENLRWCTQKENNNFDLYKEKQKNKINCSKKVYQYTLDNKLVAVYPSAKEVKRRLGYCDANIGRCCNGKQKSSNGYKWSYFPL